MPFVALKNDTKIIILWHLWAKTWNKWLYFAKSEITPLHLMTPYFTIHVYYWHQIGFFVNRNDCSTLSSSLGDYSIVFHCISETFVCDLYKIYIKTKVRWRPSWISRWPREIFLKKCAYRICWPPKCMCRHKNCVSSTSRSWDMNKYIFGAPIKTLFWMTWWPDKTRSEKVVHTSRMWQPVFPGGQRVHLT